MDLTAGLLKSNEAIGNINPVGAYQSGYKNQVEMNKAEMENEKTRYTQDLQYKLQAAISESVNPATGQPDYIKLAEAGAKYGIDGQTLEYARKHLEDNWNTYQKVAESKQAVRQVSPEGYQTLQESSKTPWQDKPVVAPKPAMEQSSTLAPAVPKYTATTTFVSGIDGTQGTSTDTGFGFDNKTSTDNTGFKERAEALDKATQADKTNQYQIASQMETPLYGSVTAPGGEGSGGEGVSKYKVPLNATFQTPEAATEYYKLHPEQDLEKNTKLLLASLGHPPGTTSADYQKAYDGAIADISTPILSKIPPQPIRTGDRKTDIANLNTWNEKVAAIRSEAEQAVTKFRDSILDNNFKVAKELVEAKKNTAFIGNKEYKARDDKSAAIAHALVPIKVEIGEMKGKLSTDVTGLKIDLARVARIYAGAMNPGAQVSEGSLMEVAKQVFGDSTDLNTTLTELLAAFGTGGINAGFDYIKGKIAQYDPAKIRERLQSVLHGAEKATEAQLADTLIGYTKESVEKSGKYGTEEDETQFTPKTGWYSMPVGTRFKVDPDDSKSEMGMVTDISTNDVTGKSKASKVKLEDGSEYNVVDEGDEEDVTLEPWSKQPVGGKKTDKPAKKTGRNPKRSSGGRRL